MMERRETGSAWRTLTPGRRAMLRRIAREGPLSVIAPWEMRTVRSLLDRKLIRPRSAVRGARSRAGLWFLTPLGASLVPRAPTKRSVLVEGRDLRSVRGGTVRSSAAFAKEADAHPE